MHRTLNNQILTSAVKYQQILTTEISQSQRCFVRTESLLSSPRVELCPVHQWNQKNIHFPLQSSSCRAVTWCWSMLFLIVSLKGIASQFIILHSVWHILSKTSCNRRQLLCYLKIFSQSKVAFVIFILNLKLNWSGITLLDLCKLFQITFLVIA